MGQRSETRLLGAAVVHHRAGRLEQAEVCYRKILGAEPGNADALHLLGLIAGSRGEHAQAIALISAAIEQKPATALFHASLGTSYQARNEWESAVFAYCQAVELDPRNPNLLIRLGRALESGGCWMEASEAYQGAAALDPQMTEARALLGQLAHRLGDRAAAEKWYRSALEVAPEDGEINLALGTLLLAEGRTAEATAHCTDAVHALPDCGAAWRELANAYHLADRIEEAERAYERCLALCPGDVDARYNLAVTHLRSGKVDLAVRGFHETLELRPTHAGAKHNLATLLHATGHTERAIEGYGAVLASVPDFLEARFNLASALQAQDRLEEAEKHYRSILITRPWYAAAQNNLGTTLLALGRYGEAQAAFDEARRLFRETGAVDTNDYREACWNLGIVQLLTGDLIQGWRGYEYRLGEHGSAAERFEQPLWNGELYEGETLLVHAEQGLGDTIQFARYLRMAKHRGGNLIFECHRELVDLMRTLAGPDCVVARGERLPHFERHTPLMSLPRIFATSLDSIPSGVPYLGADAGRTERWRRRLRARRSVGLVWAGNPRHKNDRQRSFPLSCCGDLLRIPGFEFYSLQKGPQAAEIRACTSPITDLAPELHSVEDTAAALSAMDLVISADTMVAHLAGALATPVWLMLAHSPDWRWMLDRADSPWYPTARLYRQPSRGDWPGVVRRVAQDLAKLAS